MRLIVTRPEPEASRTARALIRLGHEAILSPMLTIVHDPKAAIAGRDYQAIVVTSTNAVRALVARSDAAVGRSRPLYAVGDRTALEAKRSGFATARSAGGALDDLLRLLKSELAPADGPLLYAAGSDQAGDLTGAMRSSGFDIETAIVYRAEPAKRLSGVAEDALRSDTADGVLLFSQRSAEAFARGVQVAGLVPLKAGVTLYCLSDAVAEPLSGLTKGSVVVAPAPNQISLIAQIESAAEGSSHDGQRR